MKKAAKGIIEAISRAAIAIAGGVLPLLYYIIIIATISGIGTAFFSVSYLKSPGPLKEEKNVVIPAHSSVIAIAKKLAENNVIEFPQLFAIIVKLEESSRTLKAGEYAFAPSISPIEIIRKMQAGEVFVRKMTIPEGLFTFQVLEIIKNDPSLKGNVPDGIGEGELLPQTYDYHYGDTRADMVKRMQDAMHKTIDELWETRQAGLILQTKREALILASIVEKETGVAEERKRVAAVFINRLKKNMRLQTDPSVIYAVTQGKYVLTRPLSHQDLEMDSNYNTYRSTGLPPTPISNPGRAAIEAALNPLNTDEIYFVASGNGGHLFSSDLKQHNENVNKLRKLEKETQNKGAN